MKRSIKSLLAVLLLLLADLSHAGLADPLFVAENGNVTLTYLGFEAAYTNTLWLYSPTITGPIFVNKTTPPGTQFALGVFSAGTPLIFGIVVDGGGSWFTYVTGAASSNPDGVPHALVDFLPNAIANVGFEDLFNGGDQDYNDLRFSVSNVTIRAEVPEPSSVLLLLAALGLASAARWQVRRRSRRWAAS